MAGKKLACIEAETLARSECHAWGSLALYELPSAVLGVKPASAGYKTVTMGIEPVDQTVRS